MKEFTAKCAEDAERYDGVSRGHQGILARIWGHEDLGSPIVRSDDVGAYSTAEGQFSPRWHPLEAVGEPDDAFHGDKEEAIKRNF